METPDQIIAATELSASRPETDMTEIPAQALPAGTGERMATKAEVDQVANAVVALTGKIDKLHSDLGAFEAFQRDFSAFLEFNNLKLPPVAGTKTKFAGSR